MGRKRIASGATRKIYFKVIWRNQTVKKLFRAYECFACLDCLILECRLDKVVSSATSFSFSRSGTRSSSNKVKNMRIHLFWLEQCRMFSMSRLDCKNVILNSAETSTNHVSWNLLLFITLSKAHFFWEKKNNNVRRIHLKFDSTMNLVRTKIIRHANRKKSRLISNRISISDDKKVHRVTHWWLQTHFSFDNRQILTSV